MAATTISLSFGPTLRGPRQALLFRGLQLTLEPLNRIGFEGVGAGTFEALELARTLTSGREGKHHRRAALRTKPGLVGLSHPRSLKSNGRKVHSNLSPRHSKSLRPAKPGRGFLMSARKLSVMAGPKARSASSR